MMRRATMKEIGQPLVVEEVDVPEPTPKGVVVKTQFCGICHSDASWLQRAADERVHPEHEYAVSLPLTLGHEVSGQVYKIGNSAETDLKVGDEVLVYPWIGCLNCEDCSSDRTNMCRNSGNLVGWCHSGGFGEYIVVADSKYAVKCPPSVSLSCGSLLSCSGLTTFNAVSKIQPHFEVNEGTQYLLVIGAGGLGLLCLQFAKALLPKNTKIIAADVEKEKLPTALEQGADDVIWWDRSRTPNQTPDNDDYFVTQMKEKSNGGFHGIIDIVNSTATVSRSLKALRVGAAMVLVGFFGGELNLHLRNFIRLVPTVYGVKVAPFSVFLKMLDFIKDNPIKYPPLTFYKLKELQRVIDKLHVGKIIGRGILKYY